MLSSTMTVQGLASLKQTVAIVSNRKSAEKYRDSFGDRLSDLFGRSRWALTGLALTTWEQDVRGRINELLQTHHGDIYKGQALCAPSICHCWMLGYSQECALPTVVICCSEPATLKKSMRVIIRHQLLKPRGFDIKGIAPYHLQLYGGSATVPASSGVHNSADPSRRISPEVVIDPWDSLEAELLGINVDRYVCGVELVVERSGRKATLGGALIINGNHYGLTSEHVFQDADIATELPVSTLEMYDSEWAEEASCQIDDDNAAGSPLATEQVIEHGSTARLNHDIGQSTPEMPSSGYYGKTLPTYASIKKW